jgi:hypothetical protein
MRFREAKLLTVALVALVAAVLAASGAPQTAEPRYAPDVPRTWDDAAVRDLELPLADPAASPAQITSEYYYRIPVRPIYRSYPIYYPGREPRGYIEWLARQEPETVFDASRLHTEADWVRAGEIVFDAPIEYVSGELLNTLVRTRAVKGHPFGLALSAADRRALVAYLRTL